jgi:hypothetical protein
MSTIEQFFIDRNFSYTFSKAFPFILMLFIGLAGWLIVKRWIYGKKVSLIVLIASLAIPFFTYFIFFPIYENDFSSKPEKIQWPKELNYLPDQTIVLVTIPNCQFCKEAIEKCNLMLKRNPDLQITCIVLAYRIEDMVAYKKNANSQISFRIASNHDRFLQITDGHFPFFIRKNRSLGLVWRNSVLGPAAYDDLELESNP